MFRGHFENWIPPVFDNLSWEDQRGPAAPQMARSSRVHGSILADD